jgi:hypothetical protein
MKIKYSVDKRKSRDLVIPRAVCGENCTHGSEIKVFAYKN